LGGVRLRLTRAIILVAALTLVLLGVPLAFVVSRYYENSAAVDLQRRAAEATIEVTLPFDAHALDDLSDEATVEAFGVYDPSGTLVAGLGPADADTAARRALAGEPSFDHSTERLVYAIPLTERSTDTVAGAIRVSQPDAIVDSRIHRAWLIMAIASLAALVIAWLVAAAQARRLARPISELVDAAERLGAGGVVLAHEKTGVTELDVLGEALASSSVRLAELISRERAFTADVSHQLRTPLTGLRLLIDTEVHDTHARTDLLGEVDRLQLTVEHLLALSRDQLPESAVLSLNDVVRDSMRRWGPQIAAAQRQFVINTGQAKHLVRGSATAISQIVDVLIDNALAHGTGTITITSRAAPGGAAIDVLDDGPGIDPAEATQIFERHHGAGTGIGLPLARALAEADGGRLLLTQLSPPRFTVVFTASDDQGTSNR
jgi:signal transduction histidine kinase